MSAVYWHTRAGEVMISGAERAHMNIATAAIANTVLHDTFPRKRHRLAAVIDPGHYVYPMLYVDYWEARDGSYLDRIRASVDTALGGHTKMDLTFGGKTYDVRNLSGNTAVVSGSPPIALMAKLHGYCESHAWVAEENRDWLAGVIEQGRKVNILRADMGWEDLVEFLRQPELFPGPVVTSYSVCEQFPSMESCDWMDAAWPPEMVADGSYNYEALDEDQKADISARQNDWYEGLSDDQRWNMAFEAIQKKWWLELKPESLTTPTFAGTESFWDVVASEEWRNG